MARLHQIAAGPSESSHLLVNTVSEDSSSALQRKCVCISYPRLKNLYLPSKAAILILLWTAIVGATYHNFVGFSALLVMGNPRPNTILSKYEPLPYAVFAIVMIFYPLSGFIADVYCGRLKTVVVSLVSLLSCWIFVILGLIVLETLPDPRVHILKYSQGIVVIILGFFALFAFIISLAGYQANIIQLGLDQLFEAPSQYLVTKLSMIVFFPLYIWIAFSLLRNKFPNMFLRIGAGICLSLMGVACLLVTDTLSHAIIHSNVSNGSLCAFQVVLAPTGSFVYNSLNMHWSVLIPPSVLLGIGPLLVIATTLEFISAQSPQSMKGLLVGVFFAIRGLFQFLNSIIVIPLSLKQPWASKEMIEHPPVTNCGFVYLLLTSMTGLIGLTLFSLAAKRYKYRTRDEGMFHQHDVEEVYDRCITQRASANECW